MSKQPSELLAEGCRILDAVMNRHGFSFVKGAAGRSSGGPFASGTYVSGNRKLELHFRGSLGLVTYHFGEASVGHEAYMRALLGVSGGNRYPGYSNDPLDSFRGLAYDLEHFAGAFLEGNLVEFESWVRAARDWEKLPGFARIP